MMTTGRGGVIDSGHSFFFGLLFLKQWREEVVVIIFSAHQTFSEEVRMLQ